MGFSAVLVPEVLDRNSTIVADETQSIDWLKFYCYV